MFNTQKETEKYLNLISGQEYDFLKTDTRIKDHICLLGLGGSHAYGTNVEGSDLDLRGFATNSREEILLGQDFEQVDNNETDTVIYSFNKIIKLLTACNPNVIEILGLKPEHYLYKNKIGDLLLENKKIFLSKAAIQTFGGYATAQLRRLDNKSGRLGDSNIQLQHIANSMNNAKHAVEQLTTPFLDTERFNLGVGPTDKIVADVCLIAYPFDDLTRIMQEITNVRNDYKKLGCRNSKAIEHNKIGKHMMHLFRVLSMGIEILEDQKINTYREDDHDFLMSIRNNEMIDTNGQPTDEFWVTLDSFQKRFDYAKEWTTLPDRPNINKINELKMTVNEMIIKESK